MYAKLFASLYQGTLRGNSHGILVFTNMLAHADLGGHVDMHPRAIADEVGLTLEQVQAAIDELEAPDMESRSPDENGRRIIRLDEHRAWGWLVVNHAKYRAIRSEEDRREQNRLAQLRWRQKQADSKQSKPASAEPKQASAQSAHTDTDTDTDTRKDIGGSAQAPTPPPAYLGDANETALNGRHVVSLDAKWELPTSWGVDAESLGWKQSAILKESERFRQYWTAGKGKGTRRSVKGWRQAWSNWLAKAERMSA